MPTVSRGVYRWLFQGGANIEDFADRLNHFWTFGLLIILACVISWKQGVNKPMVCWCPAEFLPNHIEYTENTCWNSHHIVYQRDLEKAKEELGYASFHLPSSLAFVSAGRTVEVGDLDLLNKMSQKVTLYQWLPVLLFFQAMMFKLPNVLMYLLHSASGVSFDKLSGLTSGYHYLNLNERELLGRQTGRYVYNWCRQFENCLPWRLLTLLWFVVKFLYCVNIIAQMCLIDSFLRTTDPPIDNSTSYGDVIMDNIFENNATLWKLSPAFPRQVLCDYSITSIRNVHTYFVQCDLPMNEFNERAYMFIWVWLLFVAVVTCLSLVVWSILAIMPMFRKRYITKFLALADDIEVNAIPQLDLDKFVDLIGEDGVMSLKLVGANSSEHVVRDVVCTMWRMRLADRFRFGNPVPSTHIPEVRIHGIHPSAPDTVEYNDQPMQKI